MYEVVKNEINTEVLARTYNRNNKYFTKQI